MGRGALRDYAVSVLVDVADPDRDSRGEVDIDMTKTEIMDAIIECDKILDEQAVPREGRYLKITEDWLKESGFITTRERSEDDEEAV